MPSKRPLIEEESDHLASANLDGAPTKKARLLDSDDSSDSEPDAAKSKQSSSTHALGSALTVNKEYASRFEYNKKREEKQRLEEKFGKESALENGEGGENDPDALTSSSEAESEDDEAELATENLDVEISATLQAIRSKEPRLYDKNAVFYSEFDADVGTNGGTNKEEKPMFLRDYHRETLLKAGPVDENTLEVPQTYVEEQEALKSNILNEISAAERDKEGTDTGREDDEGFLMRKELPSDTKGRVAPSKNGTQALALDVETADKDPEAFLSNFLTSRAWVGAETKRFQPFESDDDEEEARADAFEEAYNLRFEDPERVNEKIISHARDAAAKHSVRREDVSGRRKARDAQRDKKETEKAERAEEKRRLRKLKIEEMEQKLKKIKEAAGLHGRSLPLEEWSNILEQDWDDDQWDREMSQKFGGTYYAENDLGDSDAEAKPAKKQKVKKPKWNDDIDITDIVPEFQDVDAVDPDLLVSDDDGGVPITEDDSRTSTTKQKLRQARADDKRTARLERRRIEELVDASLDLDLSPASKGASTAERAQTQFRYRETSPSTFGLTAHDILMAEDAQLNQYAGLKKLAAFRDPDKKRKDKQKLGKKARLRQWRLESFGNAEGPTKSYKEYVAEKAGVDNESFKRKPTAEALPTRHVKHKKGSKQKKHREA